MFVPLHSVFLSKFSINLFEFNHIMMPESSPNQRTSQQPIGFNGVNNPFRLTILSTVLFVSCCINVMFMEIIIK